MKKWKKIAAGGLLALGAATAPVIPDSRTWVSYETNVRINGEYKSICYDEFRGRNTIKKEIDCKEYKRRASIVDYPNPVDTRDPNLKSNTSILGILTPTAKAAVAYDNSTGALGTPGSSISVSFSHTIAANAVLVVGSMTQDATAEDRETNNCRYNGLPMFYTGVGIDANSFRIEMYEMPNPASGSNTVYCEFNDGPAAPPVESYVGAVSFTGADQDFLVDVVSAGASGTSASATTTITTLTDNSFIVDFMFTEEGVDDVSICCGSHTQRLKGTGSGRFALIGTLGTITPPAATSVGWFWPGNEAWVSTGLTIVPPCNSAVRCVDTITATGTTAWVAPSGVTSVDVACWGAGGGGGLSAASTNGGGGGGGGAFASSTVSVIAGNSYDVVVGTGGMGTTTTNKSGDNGGDSSFNSTSVVADGGSGGEGRTSGANAVGGAGGTTAGSTGTVKYGGGAGGNSSDTNNTSGGGGGVGGPHGAGKAGEAGSTGDIGHGGNGGDANNNVLGFLLGGTGGSKAIVAVDANSGSGGRYGGGGGGGGANGSPNGGRGEIGGGGGGANTTSSGKGGDGMCTITYTATAATASPSNNSLIWFYTE